MYLLEIGFVVALLVLLLAQNVRAGEASSRTVASTRRRVALGAFAVGLAVLLLGLILGQLRWQMVPAYLLFPVLALLLLKRSYAHVVMRSIGIALGAILLGLAVLLALALPIVTLPAPDGPHVVGSRSFSLLDESRNEAYFGAPDDARHVYLQAWYPGTLDGVARPAPVRTLWQELYREPIDTFAVVAGYLRGIETHSYQDIPVSTEEDAYPVIVFSHSLGLTAEQNTPLMEHLASHGYVVIGISHAFMSLRMLSPDGQPIYPHPDRMQEAFAEGAADDVSEFDARLARADTAEARAEIVFELGERATSMNEQVAIRTADLTFVLDLVTTPSKAPPELVALLERVDPARTGLLGMSLGGAAVIDVCKTDARCRAGVNLDGGIFGQYQRQPLRSPFLSMVSAGNQKYGEPLLTNSASDYYEVLVEGTGHGDFCDMTFLMPFMKWLGANGPIDAMRAVHIIDAVSAEFFDAYLRDGRQPDFQSLELPEIHAVTNGPVRD